MVHSGDEPQLPQPIVRVAAEHFAALDQLCAGADSSRLILARSSRFEDTPDGLGTLLAGLGLSH